VILLLTTFTKRLFARPRPAVPLGSKRLLDLRTKETNYSMPSGDAAQGSLFAFFILYHFPYLYLSLGETTFLLKFILLVAIGRVFHHCHYFGDTLLGALFGFLVVAGFPNSEMVIPAVDGLDRWLFELVRSGLTKRGIEVVSGAK
jgi:membrane-associated phospholipid phosphatase